MKGARPVLEWLEEGEQVGLAKGERVGLAKGRALGERIGRLEFLAAAIASKFGELPEAVLAQLRQLPDDRLKARPKLPFSAATLADMGL